MAQENVFESGARKSIPAVLIYARFEGRILMIHRNGGRPGDYHSGKWNGLGGKCEANESPIETARREFAEEAGILIPLDRFKPLGVLTFPNFKAHKFEDWVVFVFEAELGNEETARVIHTGEEGELHWVARTDLATLNLWPGDRYFIPHVIASESFIGTIWYRGQSVERHWIQPLS